MSEGGSNKAYENSIDVIEESWVFITLHLLSLVILGIYHSNNLLCTESTLDILMEPVNVRYGWYDYCYLTPDSLAEPRQIQRSLSSRFTTWHFIPSSDKWAMPYILVTIDRHLATKWPLVLVCMLRSYIRSVIQHSKAELFIHTYDLRSLFIRRYLPLELFRFALSQERSTNCTNSPGVNSGFW